MGATRQAFPWPVHWRAPLLRAAAPIMIPALGTSCQACNNPPSPCPCPPGLPAVQGRHPRHQPGQLPAHCDAGGALEPGVQPAGTQKRRPAAVS
jgi:hypothetical protein